MAYAKDLQGRIVGVADGAGAWSLSYEDDGSLKELEMPYAAGYAIANSYDALGRRGGLALKQNGATLESQSFSYDAMSRLAAASNAAAAASYSRVSGSSLLSGISLSAGSTSVLSVGKAYDAGQRLTRVASASAAKSLSRDYQLGALGQRVKSTAEDASFWNYEYDAKGQLAQGRKSASGMPLDGFLCQFAYDDIGNLNVERRNGRSFEYSSNTLNQYLSRTYPGVFELDGFASPSAKVSVLNAAGSAFKPSRESSGRFRGALRYDNSSANVEDKLKVYAVRNDPAQDLVAMQELDVLIPKTPQNFSYDADGNLLSDSVWSYTWDAENRLTKMERAGKAKLEFSYDYTGRRIAKKSYSWNGAEWVLNSHLKFIYDSWNLIAEIDGIGNSIVRSYLWGEDLSGSMQGAGGVGGLLAVKDGTAVYFPCFDGNGNVIAYLNANGTLVASYEYDPFGRVIGKAGPKADDFVFKFSTKYQDKETGLDYYGYRFYSADLRRWINRDPSEEEGGKNLYCILTNCTINRMDALGLSDYMEGMTPPSKRLNLDSTWNTDHSLSTWDAFDITRRVNGTMLGGYLRGYPDAASLLSHFMSNTGTTYVIDYDRMLKETKNARGYFRLELGDAMKAAEKISENKSPLDITFIVSSSERTDPEETVNKNWFYAVGKYRLWGGGAFELTGVDCFHMQIAINLRDVYNWSLPPPAGKEPHGGGLVYDYELEMLHRNGYARAFEVEGSIAVELVWKRGKRPTISDIDKLLNSKSKTLSL